MARRRQSSAAAAIERPDRLRLDPCPAGVREVVLSPRETLRYRRVGRYVEGALYRLRRPTEQGGPVLRFANRRETLTELVHALWIDADLQTDQRTVIWYLESLDPQAVVAS